ncbi:MAG: glycosyltransferase [Rothia sp. (in: high G+C Gram-positive bacteria)]|nr:glycosyltransferase [Rothia sp. (in: high G+C Gram-positive bacteria)]
MTFSFPLHLHIFSMHTSPLAQPGSGDAGGMNVYIERSLAALLEVNPQLTVEVFTLATSSQQAGQVRYHERATVTALYLSEAEGAGKEDLPALVPGFAVAVRQAASRMPQLVHSHYWLSGLAALAAYPQVPLVHTMHTTAAGKNARLGAGERPEPELRLRGEETLVARAAALVVNTGYEAEQMQCFYGARDAQLVTVAPGVDVSIFSRGEGVHPAHEGQSGAAHLVFAGRPQPLKGPHLLVEALGLLPQGLEVTLDIIGSSGTGYEQNLADRVEELGLAGRVRFLPALAAPDLARAFCRADIVACPSSSETFGLVALEASACGAPVLASKVDGLKEAVADGLTGLLVAERTPPAWADAIEQLVRDPQLRRALGDAAAHRARRFTWQSTAQALTQLYQTLTRP